MHLGDAAQFVIGQDQQEGHAQKHDTSLEGVRVQPPLDATGDDIQCDNKSKNDQRDHKTQAKSGFKKSGGADKYCPGIQGHEEKDHQTGENPDQTGLIPFA